MALPSAARSSTISGTNACWAGMLNALTTPINPARTATCHACNGIQRFDASKARHPAKIIAAAWVATRIERRGRRSAVLPPRTENATYGMALEPDTIPSQIALCVRLNTTHCSATNCIQVPAREMSCPNTNRRKLR